MKNFKSSVTRTVKNNFLISDVWQRNFHNHIQNEYGLNLNIDYAINFEDISFDFMNE